MATTRINPLNNTTTTILSPEEYQLVIQALVQSAMLADPRFVTAMDYFCFIKQLSHADVLALAKFRKLVESEPALALACDLIAGKPKLVDIEAVVVPDVTSLVATPVLVAPAKRGRKKKAETPVAPVVSPETETVA